MGNKYCPAHGYPLPCAKCGLKDYVGKPVWDKPEEQWLDLTLADFYIKQSKQH
jgi:hypothetical protein